PATGRLSGRRDRLSALSPNRRRRRPGRQGRRLGRVLTRGRMVRLTTSVSVGPQVAMPVFDIDSIVKSLHDIRRDWRDAQKRSSEAGGREFPSRDAVIQIMDDLKSALFPMRLGPTDLRHESEDYYVGYTLESALHSLTAQAALELRYQMRHDGIEEAEVQKRAVTAVNNLAHALPDIRRLLDRDVLAAYYGDPAALTADEVLRC